MRHAGLTARSAFHGLVFDTPGEGVTARDRHELAMVRITTSTTRTATLARRLKDEVGVDLPIGPRRESGDDVALIGIGPQAWLATTEHHHDEFAASLQAVIGDEGSVTDQAGAYGVLRLSGPKVRNALAKLIGVDLHERAFAVDAAASTMAAHIPVVLWRLADPAGGGCFEVAVQRSYAVSFWEALTASAAEYGFRFGPGAP